MKTLNLVLVLVGVTLMIAGLSALVAGWRPWPAPPGRYVLHHLGGATVLLLDTAEGRAWRLEQGGEWARMPALQ